MTLSCSAETKRREYEEWELTRLRAAAQEYLSKGEKINVRELATELDRTPECIREKLFRMGFMVSRRFTMVRKEEDEEYMRHVRRQEE